MLTQKFIFVGFINIALCMLGYLPGLIHSWYIISKYSRHEREYYYEDLERQGRRSCRHGGERIVIITQDGHAGSMPTQQPQFQQEQYQQQPQQQPHPSYGSTSDTQTAVNDQPPPYEDSFKAPNNQ
jgi:hypothetical protein